MIEVARRVATGRALLGGGYEELGSSRVGPIRSSRPRPDATASFCCLKRLVHETTMYSAVIVTASNDPLLWSE